MPAIHVVGTADTKGAELFFLRDLIAAEGHEVRLVDTSTQATTSETDVSPRAVACCHRDGAEAVLGGSERGAAVAAMSDAFTAWCRQNAREICGMIAVGGGGGTSIACAGMRALPYGVPKIMVSTLASGDTAPFVGTSDIVMVPSVTDIAGLNRLSRVILSNAAHAVVGAASHPPRAAQDDNPAIGLSMFGVTTPCVTAVAERLSSQFDCLVFHATGTGGQAMERLLGEGFVSGLVDATLTEVADLLCGGVLPALPDRLDVVARTGSPWVGAPGALDMVNFWAPSSVPERFADRNFHRHNQNVTLMRTTAEENTQAGRWIAEKLNACAGPVRLLIPERGLSALDIEGGDFHDPAADAALFDALEETIEDRTRIRRLPLHINDAAFAQALADTYLELTEA
ncbi:Tm-1-like ATP-binding domain-containing protein [Sulfitobacter sp. D35]|uniref:Tm-1-like ATP-binding domain-containing protein n=1 Tax=Sulfitobacter sp. D35 TaxID=3083252 RepID=UPI00296FB054|nr:Tm-1-like ATP-binding domain-containing protein [Sulfitobacter sp. D35]MDW4498920.1 Tm-1-like ATP-binding domain-containing protein [Sulfitobacter sp. D35]